MFCHVCNKCLQNLPIYFMYDRPHCGEECREKYHKKVEKAKLEKDKQYEKMKQEQAKNQSIKKN